MTYFSSYCILDKYFITVVNFFMTKFILTLQYLMVIENFTYLMFIKTDLEEHDLQ